MYMFDMFYCDVVRLLYVFFYKQKTAYEMRISDWSADVCSSDLREHDACRGPGGGFPGREHRRAGAQAIERIEQDPAWRQDHPGAGRWLAAGNRARGGRRDDRRRHQDARRCAYVLHRSEEQTSELQSLMRISIAVFCLKKQRNHHHYI